MKVKELIEKLKEMNPEAPVCLADWNEEYSNPAEVESVVDTQGAYSKATGTANNLGKDKHLFGPFVCLGVFPI